MPISALTMSHRGVNQFKEEWLKKTDSNGDVINSYSAELGDFHVKCNWCKADISFSNLGFTAIKRHSEIVLSQAFFTLLPHMAPTDHLSLTVVAGGGRGGVHSVTLKIITHPSNNYVILILNIILY